MATFVLIQVLTICSCILLWVYYAHLDTYGPKSHTARMRDEVDKTILINERAQTGMSSREQMQMSYNTTLTGVPYKP